MSTVYTNDEWDTNIYLPDNNVYNLAIIELLDIDHKIEGLQDDPYDIYDWYKYSIIGSCQRLTDNFIKKTNYEAT